MLMRKITLLPLFLTLLFFTAFSFSSFSKAKQDTSRYGTYKGVRTLLYFHIPPGYDSTKPTTLLVALHGSGDKSPNFVTPAFDSLSDMNTSSFHNCIVVCPEGNFSVGSGYAYGFGPTDNGAAGVARDSAMKWYNIDTNNIYLCGFSQGGEVALYYGLKDYNLWKGLILWAPALDTYAEINNQTAIQYFYSNAKKIPICLEDGSIDALYPADTYLYQVLLDSNAIISFTTEPGMGHQIPYSTAQQKMNFFASRNCVGMPSLDAGILDVHKPLSWQCDTTVNPSVNLMNHGSTQLDSVIINYTIDNGAVQTYLWKGILAPLTSTTVSLPSVPVSGNEASHHFSVATSSPNNGVDGNPSNDAASLNFLLNGPTGISLPLFDGFENSTTLFDSSAAINSQGGQYPWAKISLSSAPVLSGKFGQEAEFLLGEFPVITGQDVFAELTTKSIDLTSDSAPRMTFDIATELASASGPYDTLKVLISTDCGHTFHLIYHKSGDSLATVSGTASSFPVSQLQLNNWRTDTVSLSAYASSKNAIIKFRSDNVSTHLNNLYLDNINLFGKKGPVPAGIANYAKPGGVNVFPNPFNDFSTIQFTTNGRHYIELDDLAGRKLTFNESNEPQYQLQRNNLAAGMYILKIYDGQQQYLSVSKICIQ